MKKKIVMISDWHNRKEMELPKGDILIFAGDVSFTTPDDYDGQWENLNNFLIILQEQSNKWDEIVITFGNHDGAFEIRKADDPIDIYNKIWELEKDFNKKSKKAQLYMTSGFATHELHDGLRVLTSPYSDRISPNDPWGMHWEDDYLDSYREVEKTGWSNYNNLDIIVTHESPLGYGDIVEGENVGNDRMLKFIKEYNNNPKLWVSGHIHEGYGVREGVGEYEGTTFVNASILNERYENINKPVVMEFKFEKNFQLKKEKNNEKKI